MSIEYVSRSRDPWLNVTENYLVLWNLTMTICVLNRQQCGTGAHTTKTIKIKIRKDKML